MLTLEPKTGVTTLTKVHKTSQKVTSGSLGWLEKDARTITTRR